MTLAEAKAILAPLCAVKASGKPSSPGYCDADLMSIAEEIARLRRMLMRAESHQSYWLERSINTQS